MRKFSVLAILVIFLAMFFQLQCKGTKENESREYDEHNYYVYGKVVSQKQLAFHQRLTVIEYDSYTFEIVPNETAGEDENKSYFHSHVQKKPLVVYYLTHLKFAVGTEVYVKLKFCGLGTSRDYKREEYGTEFNEQQIYYLISHNFSSAKKVIKAVFEPKPFQPGDVCTFEQLSIGSIFEMSSRRYLKFDEWRRIVVKLDARKMTWLWDGGFDGMEDLKQQVKVIQLPNQ